MGGGVRRLVEGEEIDGFRVERLLATGSTGQVYLALDLTLSRPVALKVFRPPPEAKFTEAGLTAKFRHPHIVTVYRAGVIDSLTWWLALEYLEGDTLRARMSSGPVPLREALVWTRAIAEALVTAHAHEVVHADLKPENVLLADDGRLRVVDFGLARIIGEGRDASAGSPAYMSPERWSPAAPSPAMDVWSLGVMLFEFLQGERPIADDALGTAAYAPAVIVWPAALDGVSAGSVLTRMLASDPAARPSAVEVVEALDVALGRGVPERAPQQPFRGLKAFSEADAADLVGRELDIDLALESIRKQRFALVVGRSGLGKSSLIAAGLTPRFRELGWRSTTFRPGLEPLRRLGAALELQAGAVDQLLARPELAAVFASRLKDLVIIVDQLEEAFTITSERDRDAFFVALRVLLQARHCRIVLGLREDLFGPLATALSPVQVSLGAVLLQQLGPAALARAISQPLARVGARLEDPRLVDELVGELATSTVALPLLQFVCQRLWDARDRQTALIRRAHYVAVGGASGALAHHAEQTLLALSVEERRLARALLLRLVTADGSRVPCREATLLDAVPGVEAVVGRLVEERLLVMTRDAEDDSPLVELAHEALIVAWPSLRKWTDESHEDRALRDDLEQSAGQWLRRAERDEDTWGGATLQLALDRERVRPLGLSQHARAFLEAGRRRERRVRGRARLRLTALVAGLALVALGGVVATTVTLSQQREIRLAASNSGEFELQLKVFRLEADGTQRWLDPSAVGPIEWTLGSAPVARSASHDGVVPYGPEVLERASLGPARFLVRVPSSPALLRVWLGRCPVSELRLEALPGYERTRQAKQVVEVAVPSCEGLRGVVVPAGPFISFEGAPVELPTFDIDAHEVTYGRFRAWAALAPLTGEDQIPTPPFITEDPRRPMVGVAAAQAEAFCRYLGRRLPTAVQWLKAARGGLTIDGTSNPEPARNAPWGDAPLEGRANFSGMTGGDHFDTLAPVGRMSGDLSPYGIADLAGNASEWTSTEAVSSGLRGLRIVMGGNWDMPVDAPAARLDFANTRPAQAVEYVIGWRCVSAPTVSEATARSSSR